jgi:glycosyltransferase involved in cell wall biosynthesis
MKLVFVIHQYFPQCHSGTEQYCRAVAREATRRGHQVTILSLDPWVWRDDPPLWLRDEPYEGLRTLRLRHWEGLSANDVLLDGDNPLLARKVAEVLRDEAPDAVHVFHLRRLGAGVLDVAREHARRVIVSLTDFWYLCPRFTLQRRDGALCEGPPDNGFGCLSCEFQDLAPRFADPGARALLLGAARALPQTPHLRGDAARAVAVLRRKDELLARLARADAAIAPSRFLATMFERNGFPRETLRTVPYGLEPGRVERRAVTRPRRPLRVGFAGVLSPWKAPHVLVRAALRVRGDLAVALHGRTEEGMFQGYIDELRREAAADPRIRFPGPFDHGQLSDVMAELDLLVVPSVWYENTPFVVLEAFEAGVPVAVSALGGMTEVVEPGINGFTFPAGDVAALAALLQRLVDDPAPLATLRPQPVSSIAGNVDVFEPLWRD